jgi:hypothetical protein
LLVINLRFTERYKTKILISDVVKVLLKVFYLKEISLEQQRKDGKTKEYHRCGEGITKSNLKQCSGRSMNIFSF